MRTRRLWTGTCVAAYWLVGSISASAQGAATEPAWDKCSKAPTKTCVINEALRTLQAGDDATARWMIGLAQAKAGQKQDALANFQRALTIAQMPGLSHVSGSLASGVAFAQAEAGFAGDAAATFSLAKKYSMTSGRGAVELEMIGKQEARAGYVEAVTKTATSINDVRASSSVMRAIVDAHLKSGRIPQATAIAQSIVHEQIRADAITAVVKSLVTAGNLAEAQRLASSIERDEFGAAAGAELARGQFKVGLKDEAMMNFNRALKSARSIQDNVLRSQILGNIARAQASAGLNPAASATLAEALAMIKPVSEPNQRTAMGVLIYAEAEIGNFVEAVQLARSLDQPQMQATMLYMVVKAEAQSGKIREAIDLAQSIEIVQARSLALAEVALAL
jgi:tetratricopeptide (TPR) repeat protein